jgi:6-pyruvoyltetrahydropterin/6-carboxytetrahydropterin synthase
MHVELVRRFFFEAAHRNPAGGEAQRRLHGHSYRVELVASGEVASPYGWLVDYGDIKAAFAPVCRLLDHKLLNEVGGLDDTTLPGLRRWLLDRTLGVVPFLEDARVFITGDLAFRPVLLPAHTGEGLPERLRFTFEAAQSLPQLPDCHQCRQVHGHSYRVEAAGRDLARVEGVLRSVYGELDHTCLNDITGLAGTTCEHLCAWLWESLDTAGCGPEAVVVQETESARCIYRGE